MSLSVTAGNENFFQVPPSEYHIPFWLHPRYIRPFLSSAIVLTAKSTSLAGRTTGYIVRSLISHNPFSVPAHSLFFLSSNKTVIGPGVLVPSTPHFNSCPLSW